MSEEKQIKHAFRGVKGYLMQEKRIQMSRRKIGKIMTDLELKIKNTKKQCQHQRPKIQANKLSRHFQVSYLNQMRVMPLITHKIRADR